MKNKNSQLLICDIKLETIKCLMDMKYFFMTKQWTKLKSRWQFEKRYWEHIWLKINIKRASKNSLKEQINTNRKVVKDSFSTFQMIKDKWSIKYDTKLHYCSKKCTLKLHVCKYLHIRLIISLSETDILNTLGWND